MSSSKKEKKKGWSRRKFLIRSSIGLGVVVGTGYFTRSIWRRYLSEFANSLESPYQGTSNDPTLWFEITKDNQAILHSTKVEMGQGAHTGLAQIAADELGATMDQMKVVHAESISGNVDLFGTGGSTSINSLWQPLREIAATMREMLRNESAKLMNVDKETVRIENGKAISSQNEMSFGEIVSQVESWEEVSTPDLKPLSEHRHIGKPIPRLDLADKVNGKPIYGMDAELPNMLYAAILRPHLVDAQLKTIDVSKAESMPGVIKVIQEEDFIGVIAESYFQAEQAKEAIEADWEINRSWSIADIERKIKVGEGKAQVIQKNGNPNSFFESEGVISAEYTSPMGAHAQLEPNGAVAYVEEDKATVIMSTQVVEITRKEVAKRLGLNKDQVNIKPTFLGGGFGRRLHTPNAVQAAVMSKAVGRPVKSFFNRKEEFQNDTFRPPTHHLLKAKLDDQGLIEAIEHNVSSGDVAYGSPLLPGIVNQIMGSDLGAWRGGMIQYTGIPNYQAVSWRVKLPFATSWWRSLGLLANTFAIESFMDELAEQAQKDPIEFRLAQIDDSERGKRLKSVIEKVRDESDWKQGASSGRSLGFACSTDVNVPCAQVVEVSYENEQIKVHRVTCAIDPGLTINPDQVRAQCEGSIMMGLSASLYEKMTLEENELKPIIYGPYKMARLRDTPEQIDIHILSGADEPGGIGEPPLGPVGAAIANALYPLIGRRLRSMPLTEA